MDNKFDEPGKKLAPSVGGAFGTGYHVLLGTPTILPTEVINVPQNHGTVFVTPQVFSTNGVVYGLIDLNWFFNQVYNLMNALHIPPEILPIFLSDNGLLYQDNSYADCCTWARHGTSGGLPSNGNANVNTYIWASYLEPGNVHQAQENSDRRAAGYHRSQSRGLRVDERPVQP
jgi:hypothetical protein